MKFRNFLASVMADCARGHAGGRSLIPSPRLGVPMETGSKPISGLLSCLSHLLQLILSDMLALSSKHHTGRLSGHQWLHLVKHWGSAFRRQK